ncbi:uncharacterized protein LOC116109190 [Pistacia vera]|uniref:uncharacterized protein LOC116109190 n=1 Tax=Pistacia vera TaxID=55513 RepID=UPI0012639076|nr:uncharacterized protein LOC116109190 [Pistacia vera]
MEELREASIAYYNNGSKDLQLLAWNFFKSMDTDGDGRVSLIEFVQFLQQRGYQWIHPSFFTELDRNRDGSLDFWEVLTLYYMVKTRTVCCSECRACLKGLYFTCVICFDRPGDAFDLCSTCYCRRTFRHRHTQFLDSYVLLRSRRGPSMGTTNMNPPCIPQPLILAEPEPAKIRWWKAFQALETALAIGSLASVGCSIM